MSNRKFILTRRNNAVNDLSKTTITSGSMSYDDPAFVKSMGKNNVANIGLGTETETGIDPSKYPVRVILDNGSPTDCTPDLVVRGWLVVNVENKPVAFHRQAPVNDIVLENLITKLPNFDDMMLDEFKSGLNREAKLDPELTARADLLYTTMSDTLLDDNGVITALANIKEMSQLAVARKVKLYFKIANGAFLMTNKHSARITTQENTTLSANTKLAYEYALTAKVNFDLLHNRHPSVNVGLTTFCALGIAFYFREGLFECYESKEFSTVVCSVSDDKVFTVRSSSFPDGVTVPPALETGQVIDVTDVRYSATMASVAPGGAYCAGLNHYTYNHTTVGSKLGGPFLSLLKTNNLFFDNEGEQMEEAQTTMVYESFHPVNKRAIANIFFTPSRVYTYGKARGSYALRKMELDQFMSLRKNPTPAGAHKAYICATVLQMVLRQKLGPFLPYYATLNYVLDEIVRLISVGARAHIGSSYYTGYPSITQGSTLDEYMPELAQFMQTFAPRHTLCFSPHLSHEVAARCGMSFTNILKKVKGKELTDVSDSIMEAYLQQTGTLVFSFQPDEPETWVKNVKNDKECADRLFALMKA